LQLYFTVFTMPFLCPAIFALQKKIGHRVFQEPTAQGIWKKNRKSAGLPGFWAALRLG
jgi:hypothetical protein